MATDFAYQMMDSVPEMTRSDSVRTIPKPDDDDDDSDNDNDNNGQYNPLPGCHDLDFRDLDNATVLEDSMQALCSPVSRNFVVDFGDDEAWVTLDASAESIRSLLDTSNTRPATLHTRWINIFYPYLQRPLLEGLAQQYDFSPRLLALMCSDPRRGGPRGYSSGSGHIIEKKSEDLLRRSLEDLEKGVPAPSVTDAESMASNNPARTGNHYDIADGVWHYTSLDQGRSYLCCGYNSLYNISAVEAMSSAEESGTRDAPLPHIKRVWTWLLICDDKTVVTINEDPFPYTSGRLSKAQQLILMDTRRNLTNVFRSLSKIGDSRNANPMVLLPIRRRLGETKEETAHRGRDAPGLLFYYLFENWFNSYSLITRKESRYGLELEKLQKEMFERPKLHHIDSLHGIGNELGALKRHYKAYIRLIDRISEPQSATPASLAGSRVPSKASQETFEEMSKRRNSSQGLMGVGLTSAAIVRFERLRDMISLYALAECKDYLHQKDGLVQMNFQLVGMAQAQGVDRLTRVALLISKATVLFLPVTFLTDYLSTDLGVHYTVKTYWVAFAVVLLLSLFILMGFGVLSGTMESWQLFPPLRRAIARVKNLGRKRATEE